MSRAVVRMQTPEEREYARYLGEIEARKRRAAEHQADLAALRLVLGRFEAEYHARVGSLFVELDRARLAIDEYERRVARLQTDTTADPTEVEREVNREFGSRHEEVRQEEQEARRYEQAFRREQERPRLSADAQDEVKRLYRDLAKRFHPDLARSDEERRQRELVMQRVNAAFHNRDLEALRAAAREAEVADPAFEARPIGEKLVWAIREMARLDGLIMDLEAEIAELQATDIHVLWRRQESGERVIDLLETDLTEKLRQDRERLAALVAVYRQLAEERMQ